MLGQDTAETINPADYRFYLVTGSILLPDGAVLPIFTGAHARLDDLPAGEAAGAEIAARLLRQATQEGEAAGDAPAATWREVTVRELAPVEAAI
ncbi:hypothetical protein [Chloroflexus sp.]|uniref:hypothetical protein n=1 Tax=Chloroflexus sp. TaxID=1904827 RepID=UPI002ACE2C88|nr:hypothetical protein [Chloroflexus sp.]